MDIHQTRRFFKAFSQIGTSRTILFLYILEKKSSFQASTIPQSEILIENMEANVMCLNDQNTLTWLHRYIRSCSKSQLETFVRFITGSPNYLPGSLIHVRFVDQQDQSQLTPVSQTCFKILTIPRQFNSFCHLKEVIDAVIKNYTEM